MEREEGEEVLLSLALERGRRKEEEKRGYRKRGGVFSTTAPNFEDEEFTLYQRKEHEKEEGRVGESEEEELPFPYNRKVESPSFIIKTAPDNKHRCDDHLEDIVRPPFFTLLAINIIIIIIII